MFSSFLGRDRHFGHFGSYENGNYSVVLFNDGTKIRMLNDGETEMKPSHVECIDLKITDYCDMGCPMCYECSSKIGKHAKFSAIRSLVDSLDDFTEIAVGGGNPLSYPNLDDLLQMCSNRNILLNMTVNARHFMQPKNLKNIRGSLYYGEINGLGISLPSDYSAEQTKELCRELNGRSDYRNAVIHVINGLVTLEQLRLLEKYKMKVLILGYKDKGRGVQLKKHKASDIERNQEMLRNELERLISMAKIVSFDNLAIEQLNIKDFCDKQGIEFNRLYMGDDGEFTMYVNLVDETFAISSTMKDKYKIRDYTNSFDVQVMFDKVRKEKQGRERKNG